MSRLVGTMTRSAALIGALALSAVSAHAQDRTVELSFAHHTPPNFILWAKGTGGGFGDWAQSIEADSKGSLKVVFYPAQQLGPAVNHYDMARDGIADIAWAVPGYTPGRFPIVAAGELPFVFNDGAGGSQALQAWYQKYAPREMADVKLLIAHIHNPGTFYTKKPIVRVEDVRGLKLRGSTGTMGKWISLLGANAVFMPTSETLDALKKGVADGTTFAAYAAEVWGYTDVVREIADMPMYATVFTAVMNKQKYNKLSAAQRAVIDAHATDEWARKVAAPWNTADNKMIEKFRTRDDRHLNAVPAAELKRWHAAARPLVEAWAKEVKQKTGLNPDAIEAELRAAVAKYDPPRSGG